MELNPKELLMQRLDARLQAKAEELMAPRDKDGHPLIGNIYALQCIAEMHIYLRTVHEFRPEEISDLLYFEDPPPGSTALLGREYGYLRFPHQRPHQEI